MLWDHIFNHSMHPASDGVEALATALISCSHSLRVVLRFAVSLEDFSDMSEVDHRARRNTLSEGYEQLSGDVT